MSFSFYRASLKYGKPGHDQIWALVASDPPLTYMLTCPGLEPELVEPVTELLAFGFQLLPEAKGPL